MIAYNFCYCTCLGHINEEFKEKEKRFHFEKKNINLYIPFRLGVCKANIDLKTLFSDGNLISDKNWYENEKLKEFLYVAPNNVVFLKKNVREGIIPQILLEFLSSRIMIKKSSKLVFHI